MTIGVTFLVGCFLAVLAGCGSGFIRESIACARRGWTCGAPSFGGCHTAFTRGTSSDSGLCAGPSEVEAECLHTTSSFATLRIAVYLDGSSELVHGVRIGGGGGGGGAALEGGFREGRMERLGGGASGRVGWGGVQVGRFGVLGGAGGGGAPGDLMHMVGYFQGTLWSPRCPCVYLWFPCVGACCL